MPCLALGDGVVLCRPPKAQPLHLATETIDVGQWPESEIKTYGPFFTARQRVRCHRCGQWREARNLMATFHAYYDPFVRCADGCAAWRRDRRRQARIRRARKARR